MNTYITRFQTIYEDLRNMLNTYVLMKN